MSDVVQEVSDIVRKYMKKRQGSIAVTPQSKLVEELDLDSPRMVDVVLDLEDRYSISISEDESQTARTVADLIALVERKRGA